jgi:hypothetical protein
MKPPPRRPAVPWSSADPAAAREAAEAAAKRTFDPWSAVARIRDAHTREQNAEAKGDSEAAAVARSQRAATAAYLQEFLCVKFDPASAGKWTATTADPFPNGTRSSRPNIAMWGHDDGGLWLKIEGSRAKDPNIDVGYFLDVSLRSDAAGNRLYVLPWPLADQSDYMILEWVKIMIVTVLALRAPAIDSTTVVGFSVKEAPDHEHEGIKSETREECRFMDQSADQRRLRMLWFGYFR